MQEEHILVIEDEEDIQQLIEYNLLKAGYTVSCASTGEEGWRLTRMTKPNLILLDLMLPEIDGLTLCRRIRNDAGTAKTPIIMITAKGEESDIIKGLEYGADDYIPKPFRPKELIARIRAILRRYAQKPKVNQDVITIQNIVIDPGRHEVSIDNQLIKLTLTEFRILQLLAEKAGWVFTRNQIVNAVHGHGYIVTDRAVDVQIVGLRKKLGATGELIETIRGVGYRLKVTDAD